MGEGAGASRPPASDEDDEGALAPLAEMDDEGAATTSAEICTGEARSARQPTKIRAKSPEMRTLEEYHRPPLARQRPMHRPRRAASPRFMSPALRHSGFVLALFLSCQRPPPAPSATPDASSPPAAAATASASPVALSLAPPATSTAPLVVASVTPPAARPAVSVALPVDPCTKKGQRSYGTTCCDVIDNHGVRFPGQQTLICRGPQVGRPCQRKQDCDLVCFCEDHGMLSPGAGAPGPPPGTSGHTGVCGGTLQAGVWMCEIDEKGLTTRVIID